MKTAIKVSHLVKKFHVYQKPPGLMASVKSLFNRHYEDVLAVNDVSFTIETGELVGFIGPNGAGKTTTLKCLSGLLHPNQGEVEVLGYKPFRRQSEYQKQFALVMGQKNQLWWNLPPSETFALNQAIYEIPDKKYRQTLNKLVDILDIGDVLGIQVRKLSLGQRLKCELVAALLHNPKVIFLDEPTIGLDVVMQKTLRDFIREYNQEFDSTIILTSHYMGDVKELCRRIIMIDHGQIMYDGALQTIITRYARNKIIKTTFNRKISATDLNVYGQAEIMGDRLSAEVIVERKNAAKTAAAMLTKLPITDITIEEPPIEAIIRELFATHRP
jgi:ABC-2 type transport system ATP-binding protein